MRVRLGAIGNMVAAVKKVHYRRLRIANSEMHLEAFTIVFLAQHLNLHRPISNTLGFLFLR